MSTFPFKIVTMSGVAFESEIVSATLQTAVGEITILGHHTPLLTLIKPGELTITKPDNSTTSLALSSGFLEVRPGGEVIILSDVAEHPEEIDIAQAEEARKRAEDILKDKDRLSDIDFARFESILEHELSRINIATRYGGRK